MILYPFVIFDFFLPSNGDYPFWLWGLAQLIYSSIGLYFCPGFTYLSGKSQSKLSKLCGYVVYTVLRLGRKAKECNKGLGCFWLFFDFFDIFIFYFFNELSLSWFIDDSFNLFWNIRWRWNIRSQWRLYKFNRSNCIFLYCTWNISRNYSIFK